MSTLEKDLTGRVLILKTEMRAFFSGAYAFNKTVELNKQESILVLNHTGKGSTLRFKILTEKAQILYLNWNYLAEDTVWEYFTLLKK